MLDLRKKLALVIFCGIVVVSMLFTGMVSASTVYDDKVIFDGVTRNYSCYLEEFKDGKPFNELTVSLEYGPENGYSYTVSAFDPDGWSRGLAWLESCLSTNNSTDMLQILFTGVNKVHAVGGFFWSTDYDKQNTEVEIGIKVLLSDGTNEVFTNASSKSFLGYVASGTVYIMGISIADPDPLDSDLRFPTMSELYVGSVATPIPGAVWLLGSGLVGLVVLKRKLAGSRKRSTSVRGGPSMGKLRVWRQLKNITAEGAEVAENNLRKRIHT